MANGRKVVVDGPFHGAKHRYRASVWAISKIQDVDLIDAYDLKGTPAEKVVIMCTGSQGEPLARLRAYR